MLRLFYCTDFFCPCLSPLLRKKKYRVTVKKREENKGARGERGTRIVVTLKITGMQGRQPTDNDAVFTEKENNYILGEKLKGGKKEVINVKNMYFRIFFYKTLP